jgi:hypothetical protein
MSVHSTPYKVPMAVVGSIWGLVLPLVFLILALFTQSQPYVNKLEAAPGVLVFVSVYAMPFAVALIALRRGGTVQRVTALSSAAFLAMLLSIGSYFLTCPAAPLLFVGITRIVHRMTARQLALVVGTTVVLIALGAGAFFALFIVRDDGVCYQHSRDVNGRDAWQTIPYSNAVTIDADSGVIGVTCESDTISVVEILLAAFLITLYAGVWIAIGAFDRRLLRSTNLP